MTHTDFSDLLALDALDALSAAEKRQLDDHLRQCDDCRRESDELRETAALTALQFEPVTPPASVRQRTLAAIHERPLRVVGQPAGSGRRLVWLAVAATVLLALWLGWTQTALRHEQRTIDSLQKQLAAARGESAASAAREAELSRKLEGLTSGATAEFHLAGQEAAPRASANIFMNGKERTALVFFNNLPATPADKSYQLWIIRADQPAPQSAGVFEVGPDGRATLGLKNLPLNTEIKAFALTLEPLGGAPAPTGAKFLLGG